MFRWLGDKSESDKQSSERNQRAARRTLSQLNLNPLSDDEFQDCDTSFNNSNLFTVDGANDENLSGEESEDEMPLSAAELAAEKAKPVDTANFPDDPEAWKKELKLKFDANDVKYWFNSVEGQMRKYGINSQWSKKDAILPLLPEEVIEECKPILRLDETEAGDHIYKDLKEEIKTLYGPRDEDAYKKAIALRLTGKPSALGKKLIHLICPGPVPFDGCHCAKIVFGMWDAQLTVPIRSKLAGRSFTKDTYKEMFKDADETWIANGGSEVQTPTVVGATAEVSASSSSSPAAAGQVAAVQSRGGRGNQSSFRGRGGRGNRGNRGGGRGGYNQNQNQSQNSNSNNHNNSDNKPHQRGPKASPDVPSNACSQHWKAGKAANYCSDPLVCDWARFIAPRQNKA